MAAVGMKIGVLAGRSGVSVKTLRYYEELGLLPAACRSEGGYRLFAESSLQRLEFIRRLKTLLGQQIGRIDAQVRELGQLRSELQALLASWKSDPAIDAAVICPNLQV